MEILKMLRWFRNVSNKMAGGIVLPPVILIMMVILIM